MASGTVIKNPWEVVEYCTGIANRQKLSELSRKGEEDLVCSVYGEIHVSVLCPGLTTAGRTFLSPIFVKFGYVICSRKLNTLYFAENFKNVFFQLINEYFENIFLFSNLCSFYFYFLSNSIVSYISLKLFKI